MCRAPAPGGSAVGARWAAPANVSRAGRVTRQGGTIEATSRPSPFWEGGLRHWRDTAKIAIGSCPGHKRRVATLAVMGCIGKATRCHSTLPRERNPSEFAASIPAHNAVTHCWLRIGRSTSTHAACATYGHVSAADTSSRQPSISGLIECAQNFGVVGMRSG